MSVITLQSSDGVIFEVNLKLANRFSTMKTKNHLGVRQLIPLPKIKSEILQKVMEYVNHYNNHYVEYPTYDYSSWAQDFLNQDQKTLLKLIRAAQTLGVKTLESFVIKTFMERQDLENDFFLLPFDEKVVTEQDCCTFCCQCS